MMPSSVTGAAVEAACCGTAPSCFANLGTQAATTRGFGLEEFRKVGNLITKTIKGLSENPDDNSKIEKEVQEEVIELCSKFPIYKNLRK